MQLLRIIWFLCSPPSPSYAFTTPSRKSAGTKSTGFYLPLDTHLVGEIFFVTFFPNIFTIDRKSHWFPSICFCSALASQTPGGDECHTHLTASLFEWILSRVCFFHFHKFAPNQKACGFQMHLPEPWRWWIPHSRNHIVTHCQTITHYHTLSNSSTKPHFFSHHSFATNRKPVRCCLALGDKGHTVVETVFVETNLPRVTLDFTCQPVSLNAICLALGDQYYTHVTALFERNHSRLSSDFAITTL